MRARSDNTASSSRRRGPQADPRGAGPDSQRAGAPAGRAEHLAEANKQLRKLLAKRRRAEKKANEQMCELLSRNEQLRDRLRRYESAEKQLKRELAVLRDSRDQMLKELRRKKRLESRLDAAGATAAGGRPVAPGQANAERVYSAGLRRGRQLLGLAARLERRNRDLVTQNRILRAQAEGLSREKQRLLRAAADNERLCARIAALGAELAVARDRLDAQAKARQRVESQLRRRIAELALANERLEAALAEYGHLEASLPRYIEAGSSLPADEPPASLVGPAGSGGPGSIADLIAWPADQAIEPEAARRGVVPELEPPPACRVGRHGRDRPSQFAGPHRRIFRLVARRKVLLAAAAALIAALSVGLFRSVLLERRSGARAWGPVVPLSLPGTNTRSIGLVTGIVFNDERSTAMVGDRLVHEGDVIRHVKVTRIYRDRVEFEANGRKWTQRLFELPAVDWQTTVLGPAER